MRIDIHKTSKGFDYVNSESKKIIGTIIEACDKKNKFLWVSDKAYDWVETLAKAHKELQFTIKRRAESLGIEEMKFNRLYHINKRPN